jgi:preprotein translocase subunit SecE
VWEKIIKFFYEVKAELKKINWPTRKETVASTSVVLVIVLIIAVFLFIVDQGLSFLIRIILG